MSGPALLVTGFGPFPGMPLNPSEALARRLGALPRLRRALGSAPRVLILPTAYTAVAARLAPALAEGPACVLMIGVASRARRVRVEVRARNRASRLYPDASGRIPAGLALDPGGPAARRCAAGAEILGAGILAILRRHRVPAARSQDAGRYLCNASYYRVLAEPCPAVFIHIPPRPRTRRPLRPGRPGRGLPAPASETRQAAALAEVALLLARRARRG